MTVQGTARVLIVAGEASGDLYGGLLMQAMRGTDAEDRAGPGRADARPVRFTGVGGPSMLAAGLDPLGDAATIGVTGLFEVVGRLGAIWRAYRSARAVLAGGGNARPDLVVLIDYPDFNLRLARRARAAGVPVLYFVGPQVWAWRKGRMRQIARTVDRMLLILPFEEELYRSAGVAAEFVGHPLLDLVRTSRTREQTLGPLGLDPRGATVALLPGSRTNEIRAHLPIMLGAARILREEFRDLQFVIPLAPTIRAAELDLGLAVETDGGPRPVLVRDDRYDALAACDAAVVASGTATLETALLGVPMVIVYRMNPLTYALARSVSDVPHIGMANLIAGRRVVPELVQRECRPERVAAEIRRILTDTRAADEMRRGLAGVRAKLGRPGAIARAAETAWSMIGAARGEARS